jgi:hypothetical protein
MGQFVEVDDMLFKPKDTRRRCKSLEGLKACPNDSKCSSLIHLSCCYMYFMFLDVERKQNLCKWKLWKKICHLSFACTYIFEFSIVDIVDGLSISCIRFLVPIGNWQKHGMLRGLLSISIDKI